MRNLNIVFTLFLLFSLQKSFCQDECIQYHYVGIFPIRPTISASSAFLIEFSEKYYHMKDKVKDLVFTATSTTGKKYKLTLLESNFSGSMGQFFIKPKSVMKIGDTISIQLSLKNKAKLDGKIETLYNSFESRKWIVKYKKDNQNPTWTDNIYEYRLYKYSTGLAVELAGFGATDNFIVESIKQKDYESSAFYYCIEFKNERYLSSADHTGPRLFNGSCNGNFTFEYNKTYSAKIRAVDASGNFSKKAVTLNFDTTISPPKAIQTTGPYTLIPDPNFEKALISKGLDIGPVDGKISTANIAGVVALDVSYQKISDLTGIQDFISLKNLACHSNNLTALDISKNSSLIYLYCMDNSLITLDISKNLDLKDLWCQGNKLTSLNTSQNISLNNLSCFENSLITIDVTKNKLLKELTCDKNKLTSLDISKNSNLTSLSCNSNQLTALNINKNKNLKTLECGLNQLTVLDLSKNISLEKLFFTDNKLTNLDIDKNINLTDLNCGGNQLTVINITKNTNLTWLNCRSNLLTNLDISKNTALTWLSCRSNQLSSLDVSKNTALTELHCFENQLTDLNISKNKDLTILDCTSNRLTTLDISQNDNLRKFNCSKNELTDLDLSQNTYITSFSCSRNKLSNLDLTHNTSLSSLDCSFNNLTTLLLNTEYNNMITSFDATMNPNLTCIQRGEENHPKNWKKDETANFKISCQ